MSLNKPAAAGGDGESGWSGTPRWYLWDGGFFAIGRSEGVVPSHAHHAIQIVITVEGTVGIRGKRGDWRMGNGVVVRPDVVDSYNAKGAVGAMLFVDPESLEGADRADGDRVVLRAVRSDERLASNGRLGVGRDDSVRDCGRCRIQVDCMDSRCWPGRARGS